MWILTIIVLSGCTTLQCGSAPDYHRFAFSTQADCEAALEVYTTASKDAKRKSAGTCIYEDQDGKR